MTREGLYEFLVRWSNPEGLAGAQGAIRTTRVRERTDEHSLSFTLARVHGVHVNSLPIEILKVMASFTRVVRRRSFSPRSIAPVNERARPLWCASSSWDHLRFSRSARTRLPRFFRTVMASCIHHTIGLRRVSSTPYRRTLCRRCKRSDFPSTTRSRLS